MADKAIPKDAVEGSAKVLVKAFIATQKPATFYRLYHSMVEALIHPYNYDARDEVRRLVGTSRVARKGGKISTDEDTKQLILDAEATLAQLGFEPIEDSMSDEQHEAVISGLVKDAEDFILNHIIPDEDAPNEARPN